LTLFLFIIFLIFKDVLGIKASSKIDTTFIFSKIIYKTSSNLSKLLFLYKFHGSFLSIYLLHLSNNLKTSSNASFIFKSVTKLLTLSNKSLVFKINS